MSGVKRCLCCVVWSRQKTRCKDSSGTPVIDMREMPVVRRLALLFLQVVFHNTLPVVDTAVFGPVRFSSPTVHCRETQKNNHLACASQKDTHFNYFLREHVGSGIFCLNLLDLVNLTLITEVKRKKKLGDRSSTHVVPFTEM